MHLYLRVTIRNFLIPLVFFYISTTYSQNIVSNGDMETWPISGSWTTIGPGISLTQETVVVYEALSSAEVLVNTIDQTQTDFRQFVSVVSGVDYEVSVWIYQADNQARARLYVDGFTGIYSDENNIGVWQELTYNYTATATGNIEVGLRFYDVAGNWLGGPSVIYVDLYYMASTIPVIANQFEFLYTPAANAGTGIPFDITVCATDGIATDVSYTNPIALTNNGSTASYTFSPASPAVPTNGCVTYTITPTTIGNINLDFGNTDFSHIQTGNIPVQTLAAPNISYTEEIFDTSPTPEASTDSLNFLWQSVVGDSCEASVGGFFVPVYGSISYDNLTHVGTITGLQQMAPGTNGVPYTGTVEFRLVNMNGPAKGTHFTNGDGTTSADPQFLQANAPKPAAVSANLHFTENTGSLAAQNALRFTFSDPVTEFGLWVGDLETNPFGTNAEVIVFYGDAEVAREAIITSSSLAEQMNTGGVGCGSTAAFAGCGNHSTRWISVSGAPFTEVLIVVGDDDVGGSGLTEHLSFAGPTLGGYCDLSLLPADELYANGRFTPRGGLLTWALAENDEVTHYTLVKSTDGITFAHLVSLPPYSGQEGKHLDKEIAYGANYYQIKAHKHDGSHISSAMIQIYSTYIPAGNLHIFPNPAAESVEISFDSEHNTTGRLILSQIQGKKIMEQNLIIPKGENSRRLPLENLPSGIYLIQVQTPSQTLTAKLIH